MNGLNAWLGSAWEMLQRVLGPVEKVVYLWILLAAGGLAVGRVLEDEDRLGGERLRRFVGGGQLHRLSGRQRRRLSERFQKCQK